MKLLQCVVVLLPFAVMGCKNKTVSPNQEYLLETVRDVAVVQLEADDFRKLDPRLKILAYYLYRAAVAGRDIATDQTNRYALEIRNLLEALYTHAQGVDPRVLEKIHEYLKLNWIHGANYNIRTFRKILPEFTLDELREALQQSVEHNPTLWPSDPASLDARLERLQRPIFDAAFEPMCTNKSPARDQDILQASANNYYENVSLAEANAFPERYPLNSKMIKVDDVVVELPYRTGAGEIPAGLYARQLDQVIFYLERALAYADTPQQKALRHLIAYYRSGDPEEFRQYNIAWVQDDPTVETINGFIEVYKDARGIKGAWEGLVCIRDEQTSVLMRKLASHAQYYEDRAPWSEEFKRRNFTPPVANAVTILCETGDAGPISWSGINLPNAQEIREKFGSKSFLLINGIRATEATLGLLAADEFLHDARDREQAKKYGGEVALALVAMHEVLGHASGKASATLSKDPSAYLQEYYSTLEEARSDLVALWHLWEEKTQELAIISSPQVAEVAYKNYALGDLLTLRRVPEGDRFEEDHMRAEHLIVSFLRERGAILDRQRGGKVYLEVADVKQMRQGVGELLAEIMRIKATGDYLAARNLVESYGVRFNTAWRNQVIARAKAIGYPNAVAFVMPALVPVFDESGQITDVDISYPRDLTKQMLDFRKQETPPASTERPTANALFSRNAATDTAWLIGRAAALFANLAAWR